MRDLAAYDAIVLAGGAARRMGADKTRLDVAGVSLLDRVLGAVRDARSVVVVAEERPVAREVRWTLEQPPGGGPAAALGAGLAEVTEEWVAVLGADLPFLTADVVRALREAALDGEGAVLADADGEPQWVCGVWRTAALRRVADRLAPRGSMRRALSDLRPEVVSAGGLAWVDCDTPEDLERARGMA